MIDKALNIGIAVCGIILAAPILGLAVGMIATIFHNGGLY